MRAQVLPILLTLIVLSSVPLWPQGGEAVNARLSGTVLDPNGAGIPGAKVTLSNPETGFTRQFITNEAGGSDAFVHISAVEAAGMSTLEKEQRLSYELENDKRGKTPYLLAELNPWKPPPPPWKPPSWPGSTRTAATSRGGERATRTQSSSRR